MMERIYSGNNLIGMRISKLTKGSIPLTEPQEPIQVVTLKHPKQTYLKAHMHKPTKRITQTLQECLIVKKGKIKINLYNPKKKLFKHIFLKEGQAFLLVSGGYGIYMLKDSELIEIKNGPFIEDKILI